jgi:hypothetical protein
MQVDYAFLPNMEETRSAQLVPGILLFLGNHIGYTKIEKNIESTIIDY